MILSTSCTLGGRDRRTAAIKFRLPAGVTPDDMPRPPGPPTTATGDVVEFRTDQPTQVLHALTTWATARGVELDGLEVARPSLEDTYLELTGLDSVGNEGSPDG